MKLKCDELKSNLMFFKVPDTREETPEVCKTTILDIIETKMRVEKAKDRIQVNSAEHVTTTTSTTTSTTTTSTTTVPSTTTTTPTTTTTSTTTTTQTTTTTPTSTATPTTTTTPTTTITPTTTTTPTTTSTSMTTTVPQSQYGNACTTSADCSMSAGTCLSGTCSCQAGYRHDPSSGSCVTDCTNYGADYIEYINKRLDVSDSVEEYDNVDLSQCKAYCSNCTNYGVDYIEYLNKRLDVSDSVAEYNNVDLSQCKGYCSSLSTCRGFNIRPSHIKRHMQMYSYGGVHGTFNNTRCISMKRDLRSPVKIMGYP
ncbi:integumentary mucin C.1-like [Mercenaria mercenaria]|uniref:integumentary mucin C.1-like n=1 Tax=Mercenaria mercenaria TaxID=6596 RepID=UPI00234E43A2|nr:integumentary mucin C.1-like [Mercenaria mercenaria]